MAVALALKGLQAEAGGEIVPDWTCKSTAAVLLSTNAGFVANFCGYVADDAILVASFVVAVPLAFVWAVHAKKSIMVEVLKEAAVATADSQSVEARKRAIQLLTLGLTSNDDMRLLQAYFSKLDAMVNKMTHVFIRCRCLQPSMLPSSRMLHIWH